MNIAVMGALAASTATALPAAPCGIEDRTLESVAVTQDGEPRPLLPGTAIRLRIADGGLHALAGGNLITAQVGVEPSRLVVTDLRTTDASYSAEQQAQDAWLAQFLGAGPTWRRHGAEVLLRVGTTAIRLTGLPEADRPLTGTYWIVESSSAVDSPPSPARVHAHLVFQDDEVLGALSCNWLSGRAVVAETTIALENLGTTKAMCRQEDIMLEIAIFDVLRGDVAFDLAADRLDLTGPGGRRLHLRAPF